MIRSLLLAASAWVALPAQFAGADNLPPTSQPHPTATAEDRARAARLFERGERLYAEGRYEPAVAAFLEANRLAAHRATLFNIARCYENTGELARALRFYRQALARADEDGGGEAARANIARRIARLGQRSVGVLVASDPPGATVTVDGRARPEARATPTLIRVTPGEHLLLLRRAGYQLAARRIEVAVGDHRQTQRVDVSLAKERATATTRPVEGEACSLPPPLVDARQLHVHLHLMSVVSLTTDRALTAGPGFQLHATYRNLVIGGDFLLFVTGERPRAAFSLPSGASYDSESFRRWYISGQVGWMRAWRAVYVYGTVSLGAIVDRAIFAGAQDDFVRERFAFAWGLGGGIEVKATRWLSLGLALRAGLGHGDRIDDDDPMAESDETHHFPFGALAASLTFHL